MCIESDALKNYMKKIIFHTMCLYNSCERRLIIEPNEPLQV